MDNLFDISGIILSGGKGLRMGGQNKAFIQIGGKPIIHRIHSLLQRLFKEVIIVTNQKELFSDMDAKIYEDLIPNRGALIGLYTGLFYSSYPYSFCVACDMPFLNEALIRYLISNIEGEDVILPKTNDGFQPLHAIYSKNCQKAIKIILEEGKNKILDFYPMVKVKIIEEDKFKNLDPELKSFININTPEELKILIEENPT